MTEYQYIMNQASFAIFLYLCSEKDLISGMNIFSLIADRWKMDGGVAFGVVPKSLWQKNWKADDNNMLDIVTRCLLIQTGNRNILIDAGMGRKRDPKYYQYRFVDTDWTILNSLNLLDIAPESITDIIFTHFHDDHVGGATYYDDNGNVNEIFPNAKYWCSEEQWKWAINPNKREAASYFTDNLLPLHNSGKLQFLNEDSTEFEDITFKIVNGHTMGQLIPSIDFNGRKVVFTADFIPSASHIPIPYIASVDIQPLLAMKEKADFLSEAVINNYILVFQHDTNECCSVKNSEKGIVPDEIFKIKAINQQQCQTILS
jgi:glyoxylase-like metal-dependent hydrolase (beta-lactamase superfamily II)